MSKTIFIKAILIDKPDNNKIDDEIVVEKLINCKDKLFQWFEFDSICVVKFKDIQNKKINKKIRGDGLMKERIEKLLNRKKNLRFGEIDKIIINCWGDFSNTNISYYMSLKIHL